MTGSCRYQTIVESISDWIWEVDASCVYTYSSAMVRHVLGYEPHEILGKTPFDFMPEEEAERVRGSFESFLAQQKPFECLENTNRCKDGNLVTLETSAIPLFDDQGQFTGYRGIDRDVSAKKAAEIAMRESEEKYRQLADSISECIWALDQTCRCTFLNAAARDLTGKDQAQAEGVPVRDLLSGVSEEALNGEVLNSRDAHAFSCTLTHAKTGQECTIQILVNAIQDGWILVGRDVTEQHRANRALRESELRFQLALEATQDGLWDWDFPSGEAFFSDRYYRMLGYEPNEFPGTFEAWRDLVHPDDLVDAERLLNDHVASRSHRFQMEFRMRCKNGSWKWILGRGQVVSRADDGRPIRMIGTHTDLTEIKTMETHMAHQEKMAALGVLISSIAHEINNPNNFITFNLPILRDYVHQLMLLLEDLPSERRESWEYAGMDLTAFKADISGLVDNIGTGAERIARIIGNLREYAHSDPVEEGLMFDPAPVLQKAIDMCRGHLIKKVNKVLFQPPAQALQVYLEPAILEQAVVNLLVNAAQAADKDPSWIMVTLEDLGSEVAITVEDNGEGMDESTLQHIFDPFYTTKPRGQGTGLGLYIARSKLRPFGAHLEGQSTAGHGTTFTIRCQTKPPH